MQHAANASTYSELPWMAVASVMGNGVCATQDLQMVGAKIKYDRPGKKVVQKHPHRPMLKRNQEEMARKSSSRSWAVRAASLSATMGNRGSAWGDWSEIEARVDGLSRVEAGWTAETGVPLCPGEGDSGAPKKLSRIVPTRATMMGKPQPRP